MITCCYEVQDGSSLHSSVLLLWHQRHTTLPIVVICEAMLLVCVQVFDQALAGGGAKNINFQ